jgi:hypothetical protein
MERSLLDLYSDYLLCSFSQTSATHLSVLLGGAYSHDRISRFLNDRKLTDQDYWAIVKPLLRQVEAPGGVISVDDFIAEKPHTDMNEIVNYYFSHGKHETVKGINCLVYHYQAALASSTQTARLPLAFEIIAKTESVVDAKTGRERQKSALTKNELMRQRLRILTNRNRVQYQYILFDIWFSASDNLKLIKQELSKDFICPLKGNRLAALMPSDGAMPGNFQGLETLLIPPDTLLPIRLKGVAFPVNLLKHIYTNADGSSGVIYLISSDLSLNAQTLLATYHKRWACEECHKSLQQNTAIEKSPAKRVKTQSNHVFAAFVAYLKLECIALNLNINHFALKAKLYLKAVNAAWTELNAINPKNCRFRLAL